MLLPKSIFYYLNKHHMKSTKIVYVLNADFKAFKHKLFLQYG